MIIGAFAFQLVDVTEIRAKKSARFRAPWWKI